MTDKLEEGRQELWKLTKWAVVAVVAVVVGLALLNLFFSMLPILVGFVIGASLSIGNLHLLGRSFASLIYKQKAAGRAVAGTLLSFALMGVAVWFVVIFFKKLLLGVALGLASPLIFGLLYAVTSDKSKGN